VDRIDTWLNAQRGWRLLLVRCAAAPPAGLAGGALWSQYMTLDAATPQVRSLLARLALCTAASFLLAALTLLPPAWRGPARGPDRRWPTWRLLAYLYSFFAAFVLMAYEQAEPLSWRRHNGWVFPVELALLGASMLMMAWNWRYLARQRRLRERGASPSTWA
jgi:hypothetical protein